MAMFFPATATDNIRWQTGVGALINTQSGDYSQMCWILPNAVQSAFAGITGRTFSDGSDNYNMMQFDGDATRRLITHFCNACGSVLSGTALASYGSWSHICFTRTGSSIRFLRNGVFVASSTNASSLLAASGLRLTIGNERTTVVYKGSIDDVRYYSRVLSDNEVLSVYSSRGRDGIVRGLLFRASLDELSAGTVVGAGVVKDLSPGQLTGQLVTGSPTYAGSSLSYRRKHL